MSAKPLSRRQFGILKYRCQSSRLPDLHEPPIAQDPYAAASSTSTGTENAKLEVLQSNDRFRRHLSGLELGRIRTSRQLRETIADLKTADIYKAENGKNVITELWPKGLVVDVVQKHSSLSPKPEPILHWAVLIKSLGEASAPHAELENVIGQKVKYLSIEDLVRVARSWGSVDDNIFSFLAPALGDVHFQSISYVKFLID